MVRTLLVGQRVVEGKNINCVNGPKKVIGGSIFDIFSDGLHSFWICFGFWGFYGI